MSAQPIPTSVLFKSTEPLKASFKTDFRHTGPQLNSGPTFCADGWPKAYALERSCARSSLAVEPISIKGLTLVKKPALKELRRSPSESSFNTASSWLAPERPDRIL